MRLSFALSAMLFAVGLSAAQMAAAADEDKPSQPQRPRASDTLKPPKKHASSSPITDRFALRVLYWPASITTDLRLDERDGSTGTELSAENDLGMKDSKSEGRAELMFRLRERNRLRVDYMKLGRNGDQVLNQQIHFGNQTFNVTVDPGLRIAVAHLETTGKGSPVYPTKTPGIELAPLVLVVLGVAVGRRFLARRRG